MRHQYDDDFRAVRSGPVSGGSAAAPGGPRVQPFYCPYCAEEDFVPSGPLDAVDGEFHCRCCGRRFRVTFLGLGDPEPAREG